MAEEGGGEEEYRSVVAVIIETVDEALVTDGLSGVGAYMY